MQARKAALSSNPSGRRIALRPSLRRRTIDPSTFGRAINIALSPVVARVIAGRPDVADSDLIRFLTADVEDLDPASSLADIDESARRLSDALKSGEIIGIQTDYDMDGLGAHATFRTVLIDMFGYPADRVPSTHGWLWALRTGRAADCRRPSSTHVASDCGLRFN